MRIFIVPAVAALAVCVAAYAWGGIHALLLVALLAVLETTLSFDNAVVNAKVLGRMDARWQQRFLTWGIPVAVFGTRFILPILIVAAAALLSPMEVAKLAFFDAPQYGLRLMEAHVAIAAFGSAFLLMVSLKFFFNDRKTVHWIEGIERHLVRWGGLAAIEIVITLTAMLICALLAPAEMLTILIAGVIGVVLFVGMEAVAQSFEVEVGTGAAMAGAALFIYLNILDAAFSLDGVVGAFAITSGLPVIIGGLGIGALFVRSFTFYLVRAKTLDTLVYLEHGAHYAIFGLAIAMLATIFIHVPEAVTGLIGLVVIIFAYISSRKEMRRKT